MSRVITIFDPWKDPLCTCPPKYTCSPYTGCAHACVYCYITSYIPRPFVVRPKKNFIRRLLRDVRRIDPKIPISIANSSDPYTPPEDRLMLTRKTLKILTTRGFKILILTKNTLVLRDLDIISTGNVAVSITITTLDPEIAKRIEPNAPDPNERLIAVRTLAENGVPVIVRIDPIIPYVNDDLGMIEDLVSKIIRAGAKHIVTSTFKARRDSLKRLKALFPEKGDAIMDAYLVHGVRMKRNVFYLSKDLRKRILGNIAKYVLNEGVSFAVCREGFKEYMKALSCDGSHLIPLRVRTNHLI